MLPLIGFIGFSSPSLGFFLKVDWYAQSLRPSDLSVSEVLIYSPGLLVKTYQHGLCFSLRCYLRNLNTVNQPELPLCSGGNVECALQTTDEPAEGTGRRRHTFFFSCHISWQICHSLLYCGFLLSLIKRVLVFQSSAMKHCVCRWHKCAGEYLMTAVHLRVLHMSALISWKSESSRVQSRPLTKVP